MAIYYVIVILAGALALVSFAAGAVGILGSIGAVHFERCPHCKRHLVATEGAMHAPAAITNDCFFCRHVSLVHPLETLHHAHAHATGGHR